MPRGRFRQIGRMRYRLRFEFPSGDQAAEGDELPEDYTLYRDQVPGDCRDLGEREAVAGDQMAATATHIVFCRHDPKFHPKMRITVTGRSPNPLVLHAVSGPLDVEGRDRLCEIYCRSGDE